MRLLEELGSRAVKRFESLGVSLRVRVQLEMHTYHTTGGVAQH